MEFITLDRVQQRRALILTQLLEGSITTAEAADTLGISCRQVERLRPRFRADGVGALVHGNLGRPSPSRLSDDLRERVLELASGKYAKFNFEHLTEMLQDAEEIDISADSVRRICLAGGITPPRPQRRRRVRRQRRERCLRAGEMLQMDGSPHDWLEGRGPRLTLLNAVDDATGTKWSAFFEQETLEAYMAVLRMVILACGVPVMVYVDGISSARGPSRFRPSPPVPEVTTAQFRRALEELGAACVVAGSAQAKGRVERTHSTDQDRLVSLLRLHQAATLDEANSVLPKHLRDVNRRFTTDPVDAQPAWLARPRGHIDDILCLKEQRTVARDNSVRVFGRVIDIPAGRPVRDYAGAVVQIHRRFDGSTGVYLDHRRIAGDPPVNHPRPTRSLRS